MKYSRATAVAIVIIMAIVPSAWFVSASDDAVYVPITPADAAPGYAVYFADNMVYGPQWRLGNLVRIETMVLKLDDYNGDLTANATDIPLAVNSTIDPNDGDVVYDQTDLIGDPTLLAGTYMVSVPEILITIESDECGPYRYYGLFDTSPEYVPVLDGAGAGEVTREINKAGHLIYGFLWDTSAGDVTVGRYCVSVQLPPDYGISIAIRNYYVSEDIDGDGEQGERLPGPPLVEVPPDYFLELDAVTDPVLTGQGGVDTVANAAFVFLGEIILGGGSGTGGDNGGENGNGGSGGNQNGALGNRYAHK
jgi:hypothetical protein